METFLDLSLAAWTVILAAIGLLFTGLAFVKSLLKPKLKPIVHTLDGALTGRDKDIKALRHHFKFSRKPLVIHGGPGIGKTVLARKLAEDHYNGCWVMLPLGSDSEIKTALEPVAQQLSIKVEDDGDIVAFIRKTMEAMRNAKSRWLIILDNADNNEEAERARKYVLDTNDLDFIITSQRGTWPDTVKPYPLGVLSSDDAVTLLSKLSGRAIDDDLKHLAKELDYLPFALTLVGTDLGIQPTITSLSDYQEPFADLLDKVPDNASYKKSMGMAVRLAFERLRPEAKALLNIAAFMDPNDISAEFFTRGAAGIIENEYDPLPEPLWLILQDSIKTNRILKDAETHSVLYPSTWQNDPTYRIHRTTQMVLRDMLGDGAGKVAGFATRLGGAQIKTDLQHNTQNWPYYHRLAPHAETLLIYAENLGREDGAHMVYLINAMGVFLTNATGDLNRVILLEESVLPLSKRLFGGDSEAYSAIFSNIADTKSSLSYNLTGAAKKEMELEAEKAFREAIEIQSKVPNGILGLACVHNNFGNFYYNQNRFSDAEHHLQTALDIREAQADEAYLIATTLGLMGRLFSARATAETNPSKVNDYRKKALSFMTQAWVRARSALGEVDLSLVVRATDLSLEYIEINKFDKTLAFAVRAAAISSLMSDYRQIPPDNPQILISVRNLEITLSALGRSPAEAQALITAAKPEIIVQHKNWEAAKAAGEDYDPPPILPPDSLA